MSRKPTAKPRITQQKNGPLTVHDLASFKNSRGESIAAKKVMALCRCGASKNKPYCDGSHWDAGFKDPVE